ncbi:sugar ABC transporter substrate-binding protein [Brachybacterium endophyticum]|uniref:Sugar ABC transporter substrate-binding protein n=1 Tax=Brachybacterium endophyticum TaxID=2182385 RepID=A0A2U2RMQ3_9MICO|nr:sugar ABC transporter substrate-binding protein [Brachybacterium endophyticum]PWH07111.1 sugar ABC transporter substrate-binding protein [Brachybacterium endophyticum]
MRMRRRRFLRGALGAAGAAAAASAAGGCGNLHSSDPDVLTFMFRGSTEERDVFAKAVELFTKKTGHRVDLISTSADQYATKLQTAILGNSTPDVFYLEPPRTMAYVTNGVLADISEYVDATDLPVDDVWPGGMNLYRFDGEQIGKGPLYAMPKDVGPFSFGYNKTLFEKLGVEPPDPDVPLSWEEFLDRCKDLTRERDGKPVSWGTSVNIGAELHSYAWSNGADWVDPTARTVTVDTPEFAEALQYVVDLREKHEVTPSINETEGLDGYQRWLRGQIGFFPVAPWDLTLYRTLDFEFDLCPYPAGKSGESATNIGSLGIGVSSKSRRPDRAAQLAMFLSCDPDAQDIIVGQGQTIPNTRTRAKEWVKDTSIEPQNKQEYVDIVEDYGRFVPNARTYTPEWLDTFFTNIQPVVEGRADVGEYLSSTQATMQSFLDEGYDQLRIDQEANS